jgi:hypothetical protein
VIAALIWVDGRVGRLRGIVDAVEGERAREIGAEVVAAVERRAAFVVTVVVGHARVVDVLVAIAVRLDVVAERHLGGRSEPRVGGSHGVLVEALHAHHDRRDEGRRRLVRCVAG